MDILDLLVPILRGSKDEYGKDLVPPLPIAIDRVMENQPFKSTAPIFQLPSDVLSIVLSHVDSNSLGNLALVNSDCRQLARSRQFASVCFDYGRTASELISVLLQEKALRNLSNNALGGIGGAIGPCIRRLTVATNPGWVKHLHQIELTEEFNALEKSVRTELLAKASEAFSKYQRCVESIISGRTTLPHLELLDWEDRALLQQSFFEGLTTSSVQHLKLFRVEIDQEFEIAQPPISNRWNLRTLDMEIRWSTKCFGEGETSPLCTSLLRSCSHSLETLGWYQTSSGSATFGSDPDKVPRLAKLRNLKPGFIHFSDSGTVDALLEPSLSALDLRYYDDALFQEAVRNRGPIPSLETLVFPISKRSIDGYLEFLKANTQVSKLTILGGPDRKEEESYGDIPETKILPVLSSSFKAIKSLRIRWNEGVSVIPDAALEIISGMETLEQVCLGAGPSWGWKYDWLIDHTSMRNYLSKLPRLKRIAFTRDSYENEIYYLHQFLSLEEMYASGLDYDAPKEARVPIWEDGHKRRMVAEGQKYISSMPELEWIFLGQYPMAVEKGAFEGDRQVVPLSGGRDSCETLLDRIFGCERFFPD